MKLTEALAKLDEANGRLDEASTEIIELIASLKNTDPDISPEGVAIIDKLSAKAKALADIVPAVDPQD